MVAALVALVCLAAFLPTWVFTHDPLNRAPLSEAVEFWVKHPYLTLDEGFVQRSLGRKALEQLRQLQRQHSREIDALRPAPDDVEAEQDALVAVAQSRDTLLRRFSLVPARGLLQPGWLTAMFLHYGWLHLLGNLFFLWLAGPLLEGAWSSPACTSPRASPRRCRTTSSTPSHPPPWPARRGPSPG